MEESEVTRDRPVEPFLWAGALLATVLVGLALGSLGYLAILPWSLLVWPLHRRRVREGGRWPPAFGSELWQMGVVLSLVAGVASLVAGVTQHDFLRLLSIPVALLASVFGAAAATWITFRALQSSWEQPGEHPSGGDGPGPGGAGREFPGDH